MIFDFIRAGRVRYVHISLEPVNDATGVNSTEPALSMRPVDGGVPTSNAACKDRGLLDIEKKKTTNNGEKSNKRNSTHRAL